MKIGVLKYTAAYIIPFLMLISLLMKGWMAFAVILFAFVMVPLLEVFLPNFRQNIPEKLIKKNDGKRLFSLLLYTNLPIVYGLLGLFIYTFQSGYLSVLEIIGFTGSMGIVLATSGINVAHELGHRMGETPQTAAKLLLLPSLYTHFTIEHNRGHHKNVGTQRDPATARRNQNIYNFWVVSMIGQYFHAWKIEKRRLRHQHDFIWSLKNEMVINAVLQLAYLGAIFYFFGAFLTGVLVIAALISVLILESINYIEHYGITRNITPDGRVERQLHCHAWDSNRLLGRIMLYELTRHGDHHYMASKRYQLLNSSEQAPELPFGYPGSILAALIPPFWFARVHPILDVSKK